MSDTYRKYFNIDPEYFPQVNEDVIKNSPDVWKKFYPHPTFVKLLKNTVSVLERKNKQCLWVEGAYGTGKSHAVLTLKKLIDADEAEVQEYFGRFGRRIDTDLRGRLMALKNSGRILTVHRYGTSSIRSDQNLFFAIQESVEKALKDAGIANRGEDSLKDAAIAWLSKPANRNYFDSLIKGEFSGLFSGDSADGVLEKLKSLEGKALEKLMENILAVADGVGVRLLSLDADGLIGWLRGVIRSNGLKAIFFIWDEFSEYFYNNRRALTGFQKLCEMSLTDPFYLAIVTHESQAIFGQGDQDFKKLNDRFVAPHCRIELPENIAFQLMGEAMEKTDDPALQNEWEKMREDLASRTLGARQLVAKSAGIENKDMCDILPLHPYAALLLKHIASTFESNQRSMFDFIKNDRGDEIRGFQWFIDNCGPYDDNPLLTVDMLWDFFYEKGKENLSPDVRRVLDYYGSLGQTKILTGDEKRVLKTVLMLQAVSLRAGGTVELFIPDEKSIANAFEGSDLQGGAALCAQKLVRDKILYSKSLGGGKSQYAAYQYNDDVDPKPYYEQIDRETTQGLISEGLDDKTCVKDAVSLDGALKLRYELLYAGGSDFDSQVKKLTANTAENKIAALVCFARDERESPTIAKKIEKWRQVNNMARVVFIDASCTPFGGDYASYRGEKAMSKATAGSNNTQSQQHTSNARESLRRWKNRIANGDFSIYSEEKPTGERCASFDALKSALQGIACRRFPSSPFSKYTVIDNMYNATSMKLGVLCGCRQEVSGTFRTTSSLMKLERALTGAWKVQQYWESDPQLLISKIKKRVDEVVHDGFSGESARVSIRDIWSALKEPPFGMIASNLSAFIMGFVLKEYVDARSYSSYDGVTNDALSAERLSQMVDEVLKLDSSPNMKYREKYIVTVTAEQKAFYELTSKAFGIQQNLCTTVADAVNLIRNKMKEFRFPLWTIKKLLDFAGTKTRKEDLEGIIDGFCGIVNTNNAGGQTENRIAEDLGREAQKHPLAGDDLKTLFSAEKCTQGMEKYLDTFEGGILPDLARKVDDKGQYINVLKAKFDAADATWLWNIDTADQKIRETILEYSIIEQSNSVNIRKSTSYSDAVAAWCSICANIKVSYDAAESDLGDCAAFFKMLRDMKTSNGYLPDARKSEFLKLLKQNAQAFHSLYSNQRDLFGRVCSFYLDGIDGDGVQEIYTKIPSGVFTMGKSEYFTVVERIASEYKNSLEANRLREVWRSKTGTDSPAEWCRMHEMPILCLIPDGELDRAKAAFDALNSRTPASAAVNRAIEYLEGAEFFGRLGNMDALDKAFIDRIVKGNSVMLDDVNEVKRFLVSQLGAEAYNWWNNLPRLDGLLGKLAQDKYFKGGSDRALAKIDEMSPEDLKKYLKELIKDNVVVGMEIIKGN